MTSSFEKKDEFYMLYKIVLVWNSYVSEHRELEMGFFLDFHVKK